MKPENIKEILKEYKTELMRVFGERLQGLILYGSAARGDYHDGSDIDLLCILQSPFDFPEAIKKTSESTSRISLKYDVVLSRTFVSRNDLDTENLPFLMNVRNEGIPA